ncbi:hypothetical protein GCM10028819_32430 [Spirosoma humi]
MDFRIIIINETQVLLERIEEDDIWLIVASVFVDKMMRFDEWIPGDSADDVRRHIAGFTEQEVMDFLNRANAWAAKEYQRIAANVNLNRGRYNGATA